MYQALYRAYRPEVFDEILGQEHIIKILKNQLATDSVSHAYLFCGTRGTGKTTTARILAKGLNCTAEGDKPCGKCANCLAIKQGSFIDVIEMDAASNNGVENIRELRESVKYPPAIGRKKIYIIDEVHMLSTGAFNALLKTLEEPPENVVFILATTEPQKLPATILSRCMRLDFRRVSENVLTSGMAAICRDRNIEVSESALRLIAANADGSVRDGLSILDQCLSAGQSRVEREDVLEFLGTSGIEVFIDMTDFASSGKTADALILLSKVLADGKDVRQFMRDWLAHYRSLLISKFVKSPEDILNMSSENTARLKAQAEKFDLAEINDAILELAKTMADAKWSTQPRVLLELCIVKLSDKNAMFTAEAREKAQAKKVQQVKQSAVEEVTAAEEVPFEQEKPAIRPEPTQCTGDTAEEIDLELLWNRIFEDAESYKTSFNLIRTGTVLEDIGANEFVVSASNSLKLRYLKENRETLEQLMSKHTGRNLRMRCQDETDHSEKKSNTPEEIKNIAESMFGIKVEIE